MISANMLETCTRIGFAARGLMYITIGGLALRSGRTEDSSGALAALNTRGGSVLLSVMALGFLAYGIWRLSEAAIDSEGHGTDLRGIAKRIGGGISGLVHLSLSLLAVRLASGISSRSSGGSEQESAATALDLPMGEMLIGLVAVALVATGVFQLVKAAKASFLRHLAPEAAGKDWVKWTGRIGYGARGIVFILIGFFAFQAAMKSSAAEMGGTEAAMAFLPNTLFLAVALGFALFGVFSLVEARYRRITNPDILKQVRARMR